MEIKSERSDYRHLMSRIFSMRFSEPRKIGGDEAGYFFVYQNLIPIVG